MPRRTAPKTTSSRQQLSTVIKRARDVMRKDAGLNGETDRIPQLAWILFLKAFDDFERNREVTEARFRPAIEPPYRFRDWGADPVSGLTGPPLLEFVNGKLLPYLRALTGRGERDRRDVLAAVFKETHNRMLSGYLLRDVVDCVARINFASADDIHTMAHLYESMLREMRDAAGDSGEFYTPRPVIRFIVKQVQPRLGEVILDPAAGTAGFLVEALEHLRPRTRSVQQWRALQESLRGVEKKPLPYLLGMMNMLLHGIEQPNLRRANSLAVPVTQIRIADRVQVIVTNPPFGGEEERSVQASFPADARTQETALLFLELIRRSLKPGGRCGMIVPNGVLFGGGVAARIKENLLRECDLHTVVRLPPGVFNPYTPIPTNILFFEKTGATRHVWCYEIPPPEGRRNYTKTHPMPYEAFADCQSWWGGPLRQGRKENERAWRVPLATIEQDEWNLDRKNPNRSDDLAHRPPEALVADLIKTEEEIAGLLGEIQAELGDAAS